MFNALFFRRTQFLQVGGDRRVESRRLGLLLAQRRGKPLHLLLERLPARLPRPPRGNFLL